MFQADQRRHSSPTGSLRHSLVSHPVPVLKTAQVTPCLQLIQSVRLRPVVNTDLSRYPDSKARVTRIPDPPPPRLKLLQARP